jgi:tRNA G18 (ribose-2'-O)-methylase SpoU
MRKRDWIKRKYDRELILSRHQEPGRFPFVLVLDHLKQSFNVGKIIRSGNAFGCHEVHLVAVPTFDPTPAKGSVRHTRTRSFETFKESYEALKSEGYTIFALDPSAENELGLIQLPEKSAFVVGHEEYGFSFKDGEFPEVKKITIKQFGRVQSLNVSVAASIAAFEYTRQHGR